jgi:predicted phage baseplate assembly protein
MARLCPTRVNSRQDWLQHYSARTVWEFYAGKDHWDVLQDVDDETRALSLTGAVRFKAPDPVVHVPGGVPIAAHSSKRFIRCRLLSGGYDCPPQLTAVSLNAVVARHAADVPAISFRSTGRAGQVFKTGDQPVVPGSTKVVVTLADGTLDSDWCEAANWDGIGPYDRVYALDSKNATLEFGNGRIGRVLSADAQLTVKYQFGAGATGDVQAESLVQLVPARADIEVHQLFAASGGAGAESLESANARAIADLAAPTRATTLSDYESLALNIPGLSVARAHAIANYHPDLPCIPISGSTTVAILSPCPDERPIASHDLLATVQHYLERRRLVSGEIHVVSPPYTTVAVSAVLHAAPDANVRGLQHRAVLALQRFFHPLRGGPNNDGWPIGRNVYRAELLALLNALEGVLYVDQLALRVDDGAPRLCGNVTICGHGLVASGNHEISVDDGSACHVGKTFGTAELLQRHGCGCSGVQD